MRFLRPLLILLAGTILLIVSGLFLLIQKQEKEDLHLEYFIFSDDSFSLRCIDGVTQNSYQNLEEAMLANDCVAGINGGFFHDTSIPYKPVGLLIDNGQASGNDQRPSGITSATIFEEEEKLHLVHSSEFNARTKPRPHNLLQTGPFLVKDGKMREGFRNPISTQRSFLATDGKGRWMIGYSKNGSLRQLARTLARPDAFPDFKVQTAVNLDGGESSALWIKNNDSPIYFREENRVANYLGIVAKNEGAVQSNESVHRTNLP